jgi:uncharacterized membrane protein YjgN (DUF898 family)
MDQESSAPSAFHFDGNWREYAPIAFTNLLLQIVTLGVYTFWARARSRRYLWSRTTFIDDRLEWTGTGLELMIGYVMAMVLVVVPVALLQFGIQALAFRHHEGLALLLFLAIYALLFYLVGVAMFRALRYRLSRTYWHGIRGGSNDQGLAYGVSHLWKTLLGNLALGLMIPWAMTTLWNERFNAMSFGPFRFESNGQYQPIFGRFLLYYLAPVFLFVAVLLVAFVAGGALFASPGSADPASTRNTIFAAGVIGYVLFFIVLGLIALFYYSAYYREMVGHMSLGDLDFAFTARTMDWVKLMAGSIALVVCTLGIGSIFIGYRNWVFFVRHMRAFGTLHLDDFTQSTTRMPGQGEGLLDAFDVGAF